MEKMGDDLLASILTKVDQRHRKSLSEVCRQWLRVEGLHKSNLHVLEFDLLPSLLSRFPNLLRVQASITISNSSIKFLAKNCPGLRVLDLIYKERGDFCSDNAKNEDFDDEGLRVIAEECRYLKTVLLRRRNGVGDFGIVSLVRFSRNLRNLDLARCNKVSDEALESIRGLNSLETLNLQGCWLITDMGLAFLAKGSLLCRTLKRLNLSECDGITDHGLIHLKQISCLEELHLAECGPKVTDIGCKMAVAALVSLKRLDISWLINVSDATLHALAANCKNLEVLILTGCELVSRTGILAFCGHVALNELVLTHCDCGVTGDDLEQVVLHCPNLECIVLDKRLRIWIPMSVQERILSRQCVLDWK